MDVKSFIAVLAFLVSLASLGIAGLGFYYQWLEHLSLVVNISINPQIKNDKNRIVTNFEISNDGNRTLVIGASGLLMLRGQLNDRPNCRNSVILAQLEYQKLNPMVTNRDLGFIPAQGENGNDAPMLAVQSNQVISQNLVFGIESFDTPLGEDLWAGGQNVVRFCPVFLVMEPSGRTEEFMCNGWLVSAMGTPGGGRERHFIERNARSMELLPSMSPESCVRVDL